MLKIISKNNLSAKQIFIMGKVDTSSKACAAA